ncbi:MAG TPA: isoprenylcysteine carboxylmethyltransferase family protein [Beijerinckiaceae bacterium]|nr:isoprenylcysteine carboxylmethyltransferase family protein [Beijerinckiaceae bacterium]
MAEKTTKQNLIRWLQSTPRRTFVLYPICVAALEFAWHGKNQVIVPWGIPLLAWGYLQYRLSGQYRTEHGGGGPGLENPPTRIVDTGIYAFTRNPMYLGHLIFLTGLAITFRSLVALALLLVNIVWFHKRVLGDEAHMAARFGAAYADYKNRVKRWIPGIL